MAWPEGDVIPAGWFEWPVEASNWHVDTSEYVSPGSSLSASSSGRDGALIYSAEYDTTAIASPRVTVSTRISSANSSAFINVYRCGIPYPGDQPPVVETLAEHTVADSTGWLSHTVDIPPGTGYIMFYVTGIGDSATGWIDDFALGEVEAGPTESLPLRLTVESSPQISLPLRLQIGSASGIEPLPLRLSVLDAAIFGGFDGVGGWAPAPDGNWRSVVTLDGAVLDRIVGKVSVSVAENVAGTADFAFLPAGPIAPLELIGRRVQIAFAQRAANGDPVNLQLMFTGIVGTPSVDIESGVISCACHDQFQEVLANTSTDWFDANIGGEYRQEIDGEPGDHYEYARSRLKSVAASIALDARQMPRVIPWFSPGVAKTRVTESDVRSGSLSISLPDRVDLITRMKVRVQYQYERLRGRGISATYSQHVRFFVGDSRGMHLSQPHTWLRSDMIASAAEGLSGWVLNDLKVTHPLPGAIMLGDSSADGFYTIRADQAVDFALGFSARWTTRWQQAVLEDYTFTVVAGGLEAQVGEPIEAEAGVTLAASFETQNWENDSSVLPALDVPPSGDVISPWAPEGAAPADRDELIRTMLSRAWVEIVASTRTGRVYFDLPLRPDVWLGRPFYVDHPRLGATGSVVSIEYTMDADTGVGVSRVALAVAMPGNTPATMPTWSIPVPDYPDETRPLSAYSVPVPTWIGGEAMSPPYDEDTMFGYVCNIGTVYETPGLNWYPHGLDLRSPEIAAVDRDPISVSTASTVEVDVPTDLLELR